MASPENQKQSRETDIDEMLLQGIAVDNPPSDEEFYIEEPLKGVFFDDNEEEEDFNEEEGWYVAIDEQDFNPRASIEIPVESAVETQKVLSEGMHEQASADIPQERVNVAREDKALSTEIQDLPFYDKEEEEINVEGTLQKNAIATIVCDAEEEGLDAAESEEIISTAPIGELLDRLSEDDEGDTDELVLNATDSLQSLFPQANNGETRKRIEGNPYTSSVGAFLEDGVTSVYFKEMIERKHPIVGKILQFNLYGAKEMHPSHYEGSGKVLFKKGYLEPMWNSHRASHCLTRYANLLTGMAPRYMWYTDFSHYTHRFALLSGAMLEELSIYLGMTIFHEEVRVIIKKDEVQKLRGIFGKKIADFGIRRVPLFIKDVTSIYNVFSLPARWTLEDKIRDSGRYALGICISMLPQFLQYALLLRLPKYFLSPNMDDPTEIGPSNIAEVRKSILVGKFFPLMRKILVLEVAPEWSPYFF